jgi:outer membrane receptor for ferrienterochelin and colicins
MNRHAVLALPALLLSTVTGAAPPEPPVQTVEVSASADTRRSDTSGKVSVARTEILRYGDSNLSAVLRRQSGVSVTNGEVRMRGLGAGYTQILVNGDPVPAGFSIDSIAPSLIDRIDILRTASAEFGTQAIAGTINIILKKAGGAIQRELTGTSGLRSGHADPAASLRLADQHGALAWSLGADLSRTVRDYAAQIEDSGPAGERLTQDRGARTVTRLGLSPRLTWKMDNGDSVAWQALLEQLRDRAQGSARETLIAGEPTDYPENRFAIHSRVVNLRTDLTWKRRTGDDGELLVKAGINRNKRVNAYVFRGFGDTTLIRAVDSDAIDNSLTLSGKYLTQLGKGHSLGLGWDSGRTRRTEQRLQTDSTAEAIALGVLDEDYRAAVSRLALFAQDEWAVTPRLQAYLGLRWEGLRTAIAGRSLAQTGVHASVPSPIVQLLWKLPDSEQDQVRLALSRTYKAPTSRQLVPRRFTTNNGNGPTNPDARGNPDLRPELAWGLDGGYERYFGKAASVSISAYARRIDDAIVEQLKEDARGWVATPFNHGSARSAGIELETKLALGLRTELRANAARNWSAVNAVPGPDNRLADQLRASANLGLDLRPVAAWTLGANLNLQFNGPTQMTPLLRNDTGPERLLDLYALWKVERNVQMRLAMTDALHRDRLTSQQYQDDVRRVTTAAQTVVRLSLEVKL